MANQGGRGAGPEDVPTREGGCGRRKGKWDSGWWMEPGPMQCTHAVAKRAYTHARTHTHAHTRRHAHTLAEQFHQTYMYCRHTCSSPRVFAALPLRLHLRLEAAHVHVHTASLRQLLRARKQTVLLGFSGRERSCRSRTFMYMYACISRAPDGRTGM